MTIRIKNKELSGHIEAISSKSDVHRLLIGSLLSKEPTVIGANILSEDILATMGVLKNLGCQVEYDKERQEISVYPQTFDKDKEYIIESNESGSTLRFFIPILAALGLKATFIGKGRLPDRPLSPLLEELEKKGISIVKEKDKSLPLTIEGNLESGTYSLPGNISSQYVTGLLFSLPLCQGKSQVILSGKVESRPYINMTLDTLRGFGINVKEEEREDSTVFSIRGKQEYISPGHVIADGDWSNSAFWLVQGALSTRGIRVSGLSLSSLQGDKYILDHIKNIGAHVSIKDGIITVRKGQVLASDIDASLIPDLVPIIACIASVAEGKTTIYNAKRLRIKESDRLNAIATNLNNIGGQVQELEDGLIIMGKKGLRGGITKSYNDHRIAMAMAICASISEEEIEIRDSLAVNKSYPGFFEDFKKLGGEFDVIHVW